MKKFGFLFYGIVGAFCAVAVIGASFEQDNDLKVANATVTDTYMRIWISSDQGNPISTNGGLPGLWFHTTSEGGSNVFVTAHDSSGYGQWNNGQQSNRHYYYFMFLPQRFSAVI